MSIVQCPHGNSAARGVCPFCYPYANGRSWLGGQDGPHDDWADQRDALDRRGLTREGPPEGYYFAASAEPSGGVTPPTPETFLQHGLRNGTWTPPSTVHNHAEGVCLVCDPPDYPPRGTDEVAADERCVHGKRHDEPCNEGACKVGYFQTDPRDLTGRSSDDIDAFVGPTCFNCGEVLTQPGGLLFSPPRAGDGMVHKDHICVTCYDDLQTVVE